MATCEICHEQRPASHVPLGPDNDGEVRFLDVCCVCLDHSPSDCPNAEQ